MLALKIFQFKNKDVYSLFEIIGLKKINDKLFIYEKMHAFLVDC